MTDIKLQMMIPKITGYITYGCEDLIVFMLLIAQVRHVVRLPWQQQQSSLQRIVTPAVQVVPG